MDFAGFIKAVADSGVRPDEQAAILKAFLSFRDAAKADYDNILAKYQEQRAYYLSRLGDTERLAIDLRNQLASARDYGQVVHRDCVDANKRVNELERENEQLKAALAEARAALPNVVKVAIGEICRKVVELRERKIDCIKLIRNDKNLVDDGSSHPIALRLAKDIFELVGAAEGVSCSVPSHVNSGHYVHRSTSYYYLKREVEALVKAYYPSYKVELCDD